MATQHSTRSWLRGFALFTLLSLFLLANSPAEAVPLTVVNPGFEDISGESPFNEFTFGPLNGWELYDPDVVTDGGDGPTYFIGTLTPFEADPIGNPGVYEFFPDGAAEGQRVGIAFNYFGSGGGGEYGMVQTLGDNLQPHTEYTLTVEIGNIASGTSVSNDFFDLSGFPGYRVDLLAGGVPIAQDINTLAGSIPDGEFATSTINFSTGGSHLQMDQPLGIRLVNLNQVDPAHPGSDLEVDFDNVQLDATELCIVGDANCDGFVDISGDILPAFSNFTGPGSFGAIRADGDVQGDATGATATLDPHDGDVDVTDILTMFGAFTGPPPDSLGLNAGEAGDPSIPDLIYDPATGEVVLSVDGSAIIGYSLKSAGGFLAAGHTPILGGVSTSLSTELAEAALSSGDGSIGFVFPTGLSLAGLSALLTENTVSTGLGAPLVPFDLVVLGPAVPEPAAMVLALFGLFALGLIRCRRRI